MVLHSLQLLDCSSLTSMGGFGNVYVWLEIKLTDYAAILDVYSLEDILELNDLTLEEALIYLHEEGYLKLPSIKPLDFDE